MAARLRSAISWNTRIAEGKTWADRRFEGLCPSDFGSRVHILVTANVAPPVGRNVTGSDNKVRPRPARRPEDSDEQESVFSKESEKRSHTRSKRHMSPGKTLYTFEPFKDLNSKLGIQSKVKLEPVGILSKTFESSKENKYVSGMYILQEN